MLTAKIRVIKPEAKNLKERPTWKNIVDGVILQQVR